MLIMMLTMVITLVVVFMALVFGYVGVDRFWTPGWTPKAPGSGNGRGELILRFFLFGNRVGLELETPPHSEYKGRQIDLCFYSLKLVSCRRHGMPMVREWDIYLTPFCIELTNSVR